MKDFRAYVYSHDIELFGVKLDMQVSFQHIPADSEIEAKDAAKAIVKAFRLFPDGVAVRYVIAAENMPETVAEEEG